MSDVIGSPSILLRAKYEELFRDVQKATSGVEGKFQESNKKLAKAQADTMRQMQAVIDRLSGRRASEELQIIAQAVQEMGGAAKLSGNALKSLTADVERLAAAGAKVPKNLQSLTAPKTGKTAQAAEQLLTGGGVSGVLGVVGGPGGLAAMAAFGTVAAGAAAAGSEVRKLAAEAEQWTNLAKSTGLGVVEVQQLSDMLKDAGIAPEELRKAMKHLSDEVATGGKNLEKFGISVKGWEVMTQEQRLRAFADIIAGIQDPATASAAAVAGFGKTGADLIPVMDQIAKGAYKMNEALGKEQVEALTKADDAIDRFTRKIENLNKKILATAITGVQSPLFAAIMGKMLGPGAQMGISAILGGEVPKPAPKPGEDAARKAAEEERKKRAAAFAADEARKKKRETEGAKLAVYEWKEADLTIDQIVGSREKLRGLGLEQAEIEKLILDKLEKRVDLEVKLLGYAEQQRDLRRQYVEGEASRLVLGRRMDYAGTLLERPRTLVGGEATFAEQQSRYELGIKLATQARAGGLSSEQIGPKLQAMGLSEGDAANITTKLVPSWAALAKNAAVMGMSTGQVRDMLKAAGASSEQIKQALEAASKSGFTFTQQLQNVANLMVSMGGTVGKIGSLFGSVLGGISGFGAGKESLELAKGLTGMKGLLGKVGAYGEMAAAALSIGSAIIGGIKSLFGAGKLKKEAADAGKILGETVTVEQLKAFKEQAKAAGISLKQFLEKKVKKEAEEISDRLGQEISVDQLRGLKALAQKQGQTLDEYLSEVERQRNKEVEARKKIEEGLTAAREGAESLLSLMDEEKFSEPAKAAFGALISKVSDALMAAGMGILDPRLKASKGFTAAQAASQDVAKLMGGMRQAGIFDDSLMATSGAAAVELQKQAIEEAKKQGLSDQEAAKAGSAAIAAQLREQLNYSMASGRALDQNTKDLLAEAEKNGIHIMADPMVESLAVQKKMLEQLEIANNKGTAGSGGTSSTGAGGAPPERGGSRQDIDPSTGYPRERPQGYPADKPWPPVGAARGFRFQKFPNLGGGYGPLIQTHAGEHGMVLPAGITPHAVIWAAGGVFERAGRTGDGDRDGGRGGPGGGTGTSTSTGTGTAGASGGTGGVTPGGAAAGAPAPVKALTFVSSPRVELKLDPLMTIEGQQQFAVAVGEELSKRMRRRDQRLIGDMEYMGFKRSA